MKKTSTQKPPSHKKIHPHTLPLYKRREILEKIIAPTQEIPPPLSPPTTSANTGIEDASQKTNTTPEPTTKPPLDDEFLAKRDFFAFFAGLVAFLIFLGSLSYTAQRYFLTRTANTTSPQTPPAEILSPSPTPTPSPSPISIPINKAVIEISVLNGSGVPKAASKIGNALKKLGYEHVKVANNPETQTGTTVSIPAVYRAADEFQEDVRSAGLSSFTLLPSADNNITIILGK